MIHASTYPGGLGDFMANTGTDRRLDGVLVEKWTMIYASTYYRCLGQNMY